MGRRIDKTVDLNCNKEYQVAIPPQTGLAIGKVHGIGKREMQQDAFGISGTDMQKVSKDGLLLVLADGMGGMCNGERASMATVVSCLDFFEQYGIGACVSDELVEMLHEANACVKRELGVDVGAGGSTAIAAYIYNKMVSWVSVGDSRIYLYRKNKLHQLNKEHNYAATLEDMVKQGQISREAALCDPQRAALTSFMGLEDIPEIDRCEEPFMLKKGDRLLLMSDGVFGTLSDVEMISAMQYLPDKAAMSIGMQIEQKKRKNQDNYTAIILEAI